MVVWMVVMNRCAIVVLLSVGERISNIVRGKVRYMMCVLVDVDRCRCVIDVMYRSIIVVVLIVVVNMSLCYGHMSDSGLVIDFMCHDWLVVDLMCNNGLVVDFVSHNGLVNDFVRHNVCVLWRSIILCS